MKLEIEIIIRYCGKIISNWLENSIKSKEKFIMSAYF